MSLPRSTSNGARKKRLTGLVLALFMFISSSAMLIPTQRVAAGLDVSGGTMTVDVTWTLSDSPVNVLGALSIAQGAKLRIMPGVDVVMAAGSFLEVKGKFEATGTSSSPIKIRSMTSFDRVNVTQGGNATFEHVSVQNSSRGLFVESTGSKLMVKNSTVQSAGTGITAQSGAEAWAVSCRFQATRNVSVSGAKVHEGNWLFFRAFRDDNLKGYPGVELEVTATKPQAYSWTIFDSKAGDPQTDSTGKLSPIIVEQYLHEGSSSGSRVVFQMRMWEKNWFKTEYPLYMGKDMYYNWSLDLTPPASPINLTAKERGDHWIRFEWEIGNVPDLKEFNLSYKMDWQAEKDYSIISVPNTLRGHNLTGLVEEMRYDIKLNALDFSENPSPYIGPIKVKTLDLTAPDPPKDLTLVAKGGTWASLEWDVSPSFDVMGYKVFRNGTEDRLIEMMDVPGRLKLEANITGLSSETEYSLWVEAYDDAEVPNLSNMNASITVRTLDITPPLMPEMELWFVDPSQYHPGSLYYNGTNVGLRGRILGEDRDFVDVLVNDAPYLLPDGVSRFTSDKGNYSFFIQLPEGTSKLRVRAVDPAGNLGQLSEERSVVIDTVPPTLEIWQKGSPTLIVDKDETFTLNCTVNDLNSIDKVTWIVEGPSFQRELDGEEIEIDLPLGEYTARCQATDIAGNSDTSFLRISSLVPDVTPPKVVASNPVNGSIVPIDTDIWVRFSEALDWGALLHRLFELDIEVGLVDHELIVDEENLTIMLRLTDNLKDSMNYSLRLERLFDLRGNKAPDFEVAFMTVDKDTIDSDDDGIPDHFEVRHISFLSPSDPSDAAKDKDKDGLTNLEEYRAGTDLEDPDSDKDGMDDGWEVRYGLDPLSNADAMQDLDDDGYANLDEYKAGTDPTDRNDNPGSSVGEKVPLWMILLGIAVVVLLIGVIIGSVVIFSRKGGSEEAVPAKGTGEVSETASAAPSDKGLDECPDCGTPLEEGTGVCPVCGVSADVGSGSLEEGHSGPLEEATGSEVPEEDEDAAEEGSDDDGLPINGEVAPPEEEEGP
ncbi:MAG: fibronectin type III domain-containing protein [Candidatus Thermoplasmatota archaeon]|nr:fibronectin type III domain-containing protein [Candidatus Thermoplasmatota archaeon]